MNYPDIVKKIYKNTGTNVASYPPDIMLIDINNGKERTESVIIKNDNRWQWDDINFDDLPIGVTDLKSGQQDYGYDVTHLSISRMRVKDRDLKWHVLQPIDEDDQNYAVVMDDTQQGQPKRYDKRGASLFLGPIPDYELADGLEVTFQRAGKPVTIADLTDVTAKPGFNSLFHELVVLWPSHDFWLPKKPEMSTGFLRKITMLEADMATSYNRRAKDEVARMRPARESNR